MANEANYGSASGFILRPGYYATRRPPTSQQLLSVTSASNGIRAGITDLNSYAPNLSKLLQSGGYRIIYFEDFIPKPTHSGETHFIGGETDACSGTIYGQRAASGDTAHFVVAGRTSPNGILWNYQDTTTATIHEFGHAIDDLLGENYGSDHLHLSDAFRYAITSDIAAYRREFHTDDENVSFDYLSEFYDPNDSNKITDHWKEVIATLVSSIVESAAEFLSNVVFEDFRRPPFSV